MKGITSFFSDNAGVRSIFSTRPLALETVIGHPMPADTIFVEGFKPAAIPVIGVYRNDQDSPSIGARDGCNRAIMADARSKLAPAVKRRFDLTQFALPPTVLAAHWNLEAKQRGGIMTHRYLAVATLGLCLAMTAAASASAGARDDPQEAGPASRGLSRSVVLERLEQLEARSEALARENAALRLEIDALRAALRQDGSKTSVAGDDESAETARLAAARTSASREASASEDEAATAPDPAVTIAGRRIGLGGQYRVNGYVVDDDVGGVSRAAARLRLRQNLDFEFSDRFSTHLQFELSHTSDNVTTTSESSRSTNIDIRHAVLTYRFGKGIKAEAGILPISDRFLDTEYSADWDYNPLAVQLEVPLGPGRLRAFAAELDEGQETIADDFLHLGADYLWQGESAWIDFSLQLINAAAPDGRQQEHLMAGASASMALDHGLRLSSFLTASRTDRALLGSGRHGRGLALALRLDGPGGWSLLATHATGRRDGTGFLPIMALARTYGYWGLTGLLTVQGPTDTGFDGDGVNISNNGFGLTSIQGRYRFDLAKDWQLALAAGYFGNSRTPAERRDFLGVDLMGMASWQMSQYLALDFGIAYARIDDALSGYTQGVIGGTAFNGPAGTRRNKVAGFSRLQAEFP